MATGTQTALPSALFPPSHGPVSFLTLSNRVRTEIHRFLNFEIATDQIFRNYDVATAFTREVLSCELRADIKKERRRSSIKKTDKNLVEYVRVLLHYEIGFTDAVLRTLAQYEIRNYSAESRRIFDLASHELNGRSQRAKQARKNFYGEGQA